MNNEFNLTLFYSRKDHELIVILWLSLQASPRVARSVTRLMHFRRALGVARVGGMGDVTGNTNMIWGMICGN